MSSRSTRARRTKKTRAPLFIVLGIVFACFSLCVAGVVGLIKSSDKWLAELPDYASITDFNIAGPTTILADDGETVLAELYLEYRIPVTRDQVSPYVFDATVDTEDVRFYDHEGVDLQGILRAIFVNLGSGGAAEGASTITQQLVRNTLLVDEMTEKTIKRKVREAYLATEIEKIYSKDDILMMYLNSVNYGDGVYGIQAAAQHYFSKDARDLTLGEASLLAGVPQSPARLNPVANYDAAVARRQTVLRRMLTNGSITQEQFDEANAEPVELNIADSPSSGVEQEPYFVDYVRSFLSDTYSNSELLKGGLTIKTTLNMKCQRAAENACDSALASQPDDVQCALASVDPDTGYIVAMYGGKDYEESQFNLATQASRQCGSSFKTFTLTAAVEEGISPDENFDGSSPMKITDNWTVSNDSGENYKTVSLAQATRLSLNTVYAQLIHDIGPDKVVDVAHRMGIKSDLEAVDSLTLGTQGVNPLEMASAYGTLATGGVHHEPICVTEIIDSNGNVVYTAKDNSSQALDEDVSKTVTDVLKGDIISGTGTRARLASGQIAAGKTGTTQNYRDGYFVGYTPQLSTAVWVGTLEERQVYWNGGALYGGSACCPIWKSYTDAALAGEQLEYFPGDTASTSYNYYSGSGSQYTPNSNETGGYTYNNYGNNYNSYGNNYNSYGNDSTSSNRSTNGNRSTGDYDDDDDEGTGTQRQGNGQ